MSLCGKPVLNFEDVQCNGEKFIIAVGFHQLNKLREKYFWSLIKKGFTPASFIDPALKEINNIHIDQGSIVLEKTSIHYNTRIGKNVFIATGANIGHDCIIKDNAWINSGVTIAGNTTIGSNTVLGINATIGNDIVLGDNNFIGAATLITKNTEDNACYATEATKQLPISADAFMAFTQKIS